MTCGKGSDSFTMTCWKSTESFTITCGMDTDTVGAKEKFPYRTSSVLKSTLYFLTKGRCGLYAYLNVLITSSMHISFIFTIIIFNVLKPRPLPLN